MLSFLSLSSAMELIGHRHASTLVLRAPPASDLPLLSELETASYPADEAASPEQLEFRLTQAPAYFLGIYPHDDSLSTSDEKNAAAPIGFICGTLAIGTELTEETMSGHEPSGESLCIHSVVVAPDLRRQGIARAALKAYLETIRTSQINQVAQALLICKANLMSLYSSAGFIAKGLSPVVHGADPWFEMRYSHLRKVPFTVVDAFASEQFQGNPAAVVFRHWPEAPSTMQAVAAEFNLAETAFVQRRGVRDGWDLRWFTPTVEVDLCGHATLAAAYALLSAGVATSPINFHTKSGILQVVQDKATGRLSMDFPAEPTDVSLYGKGPDAATIAACFGLSDPSVILFSERNRIDLLVEIESSAFADLKPDLAAIAAIGGRGVLVTTKGCPQAGSNLLSSPPSDLKVDFTSRCFFPASGIDEDPVTGSAHCALGPHWAKQLGKDALIGWQASKRGGAVAVALREGGRVELAGSACTVSEGLLSA